MSLRHGILGLLAEGPASGYDLARRFQEILSPIWPAHHPNIYTELKRLHADRLIDIEGRGPRGRLSYRINDDGMAEIRRWLTEGTVDHSLRLEPVLRSFFFWLMDPEELARHLDSESAFYEETAKRYRSYADKAERGEYGDAPRVDSLRAAIEAAIRFHEALAHWIQWVQAEQLPAGTHDDG